MSAAGATRGAGTGEPGQLDCGPLKPAGSAEAGSTTSDREAVPGISPRTLQRALPAAPLAPLLDAILKDDVAALDAYLRQDKSAVDAVVCGQPVLFFAVTSGHRMACELLLAHGADPSVRTLSAQWTPLHAAAERGDMVVLTMLLNSGNANVNAVDVDGWTPLHVAAYAGFARGCSVLVRHGARVHRQTQHGLTAAHVARLWRHNTAYRFLRAMGRQLEARLCEAAAVGDQTTVEALLEAGVRANAADATSDTRRTPLHHAARGGHSRIVGLLLAHGAQPSPCERVSRWTPLHHAAEAGHQLVLDALVHGGAALDAADQDGWTPLHVAACAGHRRAVASLLVAGADVNCETEQAATAEELAMAWQHADVLQLLAVYKEHHVPSWTIAEAFAHIARVERAAQRITSEWECALRPGAMRSTVALGRAAYGRAHLLERVFNPHVSTDKLAMQERVLAASVPTRVYLARIQLKVNAALLVAQTMYAHAAAQVMAARRPPHPSRNPTITTDHLTAASKWALPLLQRIPGVRGLERLGCAGYAHGPTSVRRLANLCPAAGAVPSEAVASTLARWCTLHHRDRLLQRCAGLSHADTVRVATTRADCHASALIDAIAAGQYRVHTPRVTQEASVQSLAVFQVCKASFRGVFSCRFDPKLASRLPPPPELHGADSDDAASGSSSGSGWSSGSPSRVSSEFVSSSDSSWESGCGSSSSWSSDTTSDAATPSNAESVATGTSSPTHSLGSGKQSPRGEDDIVTIAVRRAQKVQRTSAKPTPTFRRWRPDGHRRGDSRARRHEKRRQRRKRRSPARLMHRTGTKKRLGSRNSSRASISSHHSVPTTGLAGDAIVEVQPSARRSRQGLPPLAALRMLDSSGCLLPKPQTQSHPESPAPDVAGGNDGALVAGSTEEKQDGTGSCGVLNTPPKAAGMTRVAAPVLLAESPPVEAPQPPQSAPAAVSAAMESQGLLPTPPHLSSGRSVGSTGSRTLGLRATGEVTAAAGADNASPSPPSSKAASGGSIASSASGSSPESRGEGSKVSERRKRKRKRRDGNSSSCAIL